MKVRLAIRGFADGNQKFEERVDVDSEHLDELLPAIATKHAKALVEFKLHMIEIEFLDEPAENERYFRIGTDPSAMVLPIGVKLK